MASRSETLSALLQRTTVDDHEQILKECNGALKTSKNDPELLHVRVVALLKLDRYEDALQALKEHETPLKERTKFEKAYALYKVGQLEEAKAAAKGAVDDRGATHVEAQASYRSEDFANASALYKRLASNGQTDLDTDNDLRVNSSATDAQLEWTRHANLVGKKKPAREDLEIFETAYNSACASIARGELEQGRVLLKRAQDVCMSNEYLSDDEKAAEILPIRVQQLYVLTQLGRHEEAESFASQIVAQDITDLSTRKIARNNLIAATRKISNPYLSRRTLDIESALPKTDQLFSYQTDSLKENNLALELQVQKPKAVIKATKTVLASTQPTSSAHVNSLSVLNAAAHAQDDLPKSGLKQILPLFEKRPADVGLAMTIIQLYTLTQNHGSAISVLDKLISHLSDSSNKTHEDVLYAPGLVALQVSLYGTQNRKTHIKTALAKAATYWRRKSKPPAGLLQAAGTSLLDSADPEHQRLAREVFSILHQSDPSSKIATAGFVASHAHTCPESITEDDLSALPTIEEQIRGIDVSALEAAGVPSLPGSGTSSRKRPLVEKPKPPKKKRTRHSRLPKDHLDPNKKPDPERWLPLRERSSYKPPKKKGKKRDVDRERTQGGIVNEKLAEKGGEIVKGGEKGGGGGGGGKNKGKKKAKR